MALGRPGEKGKEHCNPDTSRSSGRSLENLGSSGRKLPLCTASSIQRLAGHLQVLLACRSCAPGPDAPVFLELFYLLGLRAFLQQRRVPALSPESPADPAPPWALPVLCRSFPSLLLPLISEQFPAWFDLIFTALQPHTCAQTLQKCTRGLRWWDAPRGAPNTWVLGSGQGGWWPPMCKGSLSQQIFPGFLFLACVLRHLRKELVVQEKQEALRWNQAVSLPPASLVKGAAVQHIPRPPAPPAPALSKKNPHSTSGQSREPSISLRAELGAKGAPSPCRHPSGTVPSCILPLATAAGMPGAGSCRTPPAGCFPSL